MALKHSYYPTSQIITFFLMVTHLLSRTTIHFFNKFKPTCAFSIHLLPQTSDVAKAQPTVHSVFGHLYGDMMLVSIHIQHTIHFKMCFIKDSQIGAMISSSTRPYLPSTWHIHHDHIKVFLKIRNNSAQIHLHTTAHL
jgi:hypothetical protein